MNIRFLRVVAAFAAFAAGTFCAAGASAEIFVVDKSATAQTDLGYVFAHPTLRSVVFISNETRQMAILPPAPIFIQPPPLLWRAATTPFPAYPPAGNERGVNASPRPSNRDVVTYHLQRAHSFSQELFYRDTYLSLGSNPVTIWGGSVMPAYPPAAAGSNRPSNRDNTTYNLERAHRYSADAYKKP